MNIIKGADNTLVFSFEGVNPNCFEQIFVYIKDAFQSLKKTGDDIIWDGDKMKVEISQEESLGFGNRSVKVQVRCITKHNTAITSSIVKVPVIEVLEEEVIPDEQ